uniref:Uncharacterized protein n=1 Tax=Amphiprion ocellaris TaxID=80972 RepID=A0AAQ5ZAT9_AMPOC
MNAARKRLKLSTSKLQSATDTSSHDALLLPPTTPAGGGAEEAAEEGYLLVMENTTDSSLVITMEDSQVEVKAARRKAARKRSRKVTNDEESGRASESEEEEAGVDVEIDRQLDQSLETKSKQHNLTTVNVRNIIHEVITNEHVVAMMKAAINETEAVPPFEPKMTRSKFKEVVEKGVVSLFTVHHLKSRRTDSKSSVSCQVIPAWNISPIKKTSDAHKAPQFVDIPLAEEDSSDEEYRPDEEDEDETAEDTFQESDMESTTSSPRGSRLSRVDEESCSPWQVTAAYHPTSTIESDLIMVIDYQSPCQPLSESEDEAGLMAYRTRSKRPLRDIPLGQLEAELRAPDITPDMYDSSSAHEDREWTDWLRGLMTSDMDNEEECDDEDDPEYNFLADNDEPDLEDYRDDKAVRITKKEVNELMEELFETDLAGQEVDDEGHEEEEEPQEETQIVQTHAQQHFGYTLSVAHLFLSVSHRSVSQHVQLLTQVHLLSSPVSKLQSEAETSRQFLFELNILAQRGELIRSADRPGFCSVFRASNLQGALQLLEELRQAPIKDTVMRSFPVMPAELAWIFATRPVFLYPELLPCASLDPNLYCPRRTAAFTAAEDCLLVLGLRNMEGSCDPPKLVSQFLYQTRFSLFLWRDESEITYSLIDAALCLQAFRYQRLLWSMPVACRHVDPAERRPPVEREESVMPLWLVVGKQSSATRERIRRHCQMLACLRRSRVTPPPAGRDALNTTLPPPPEGPSSLPLLADDVIRVKEEEEEEEEEEEGDIRLTLSESSSSAAGSDDDLEEAEPDRKQEQTLPSREKEDRGTSSDESRASVVQLQVSMQILFTCPCFQKPTGTRTKNRSPGKTNFIENSADSDGDDQSEDVAFAQDYLHRVSTGLPEQLLQVLDEFSAAGPQEAPDVLYSKLSSILQPWPQLLRDFAAFLNCRQAQRCSLLLEQQLFERSRRFLRRLRRSLGESSAPYQQVVSVLQGSPAPSPEDMDQVSADHQFKYFILLQQEVCDFLSQLHAPSLPKAASADTDCISHNPPDRNIFDPQTANDRKERAEPRVAGAKNNKMEAKGGEVVTWTRDADRLILTTCQQRGANQSTFRQVSAQLGNRTVQQV